MITDDLYKMYLTYLLAGNRVECARIVNALINKNTSIKELYINLFQRSMYEVGTLWEFNKISVATEHLCTSITESLITLCYPLLFSAEHSGKKAVITCTPGEYHQLGARMVADYFELYGWDGYFLGADTPAAELISYLYEKKPDLVALSISVSFNFAELQRLALKIREQFPELPIIAGGQGFRWGGENSLDNIYKVYIIRSLDELVTRFLTSQTI
ncbi:MAG: cobalamin-dependent protein [Bacteroidota bacterium]